MEKDPHVNTVETEITTRLKEAYDLRGSDLMQSLSLTNDLLQQCIKIDFKEGIAKCKNQLGLFYLIRGEFEKAKAYSQEALNYFEERNNLKGIADARYNIGGIYYRTNKYHLGLIELSHCQAAYRQLNDFHNLARTYKSIGTIYEYFNDREKAIEAYEKSIDASRHVNDLSLESNALNPLSGIYNKQGKEKLAYETIERSIVLKKQTNDIRGLAFALYGRGKLYAKSKRFEDALADFEKVAEILSSVEDMLGLGMAYNKIGIVKQEMGKTTEAKSFFIKALELGEKYKVQFVSFKANFNLYNLSKKEGDIAQALFYLERYYTQKEEVLNSENYNIIKSYETLSKIESLERESKAQKEKNDIVENKNAELDSFFYRVSHDLKGPISSLLGLHHIVKMDIQDTKALRYFAMYHHQIQRINNIIMSLIDITRMKHIEVQKKQIDFESLIDECIQSYTFFENFNTINFIKEVKPGIIFFSEWAIVNTILQNLIENAIKYSRKGINSFVRISIDSKENKLIIVVEDNGQGIPVLHQTKIFEMFHRANDRVQGSGLGLYILKRATERLRGKIELVSELHVGSKFIVQLPIE